MVGNLLQVIYNTVDSYFLGKIGKEALSAPSITMFISGFVIVFGLAFTMAGTTLISQYYGHHSRDRRYLSLLSSQVFLLNMILAVLITAAGYLATKPLLSLLKVPEGLTFDYTYTYMSIIFLTMPFFFLDLTFKSVFQGMKDSRTPLIVQICSVTLNLVLDPIFIFGLGPVPRLEVFGAALATFIARAVGGLIALIFLIRGRDGVRLSLSLMKPHLKILKKIWSIGFPSSVGMTISSFGFAVMQGRVNLFGPAVIAAMGVGNRIQSLFYLPSQGITQGVAILAGNALGKGQKDEARSIVHSGLLLSFLFVTIGMLLVTLFGDEVIRFFVDDAEVVREGVMMFRITSAGVVFFSLFMVMSGAFQAGGRTKVLMAMQVTRLWVLRVPLVALLPSCFALGSYGMYLAMLLSNIGTLLWGIVYFRKGAWQSNLANP